MVFIFDEAMPRQVRVKIPRRADIRVAVTQSAICALTTRGRGPATNTVRADFGGWKPLDNPRQGSYLLDGFGRQESGLNL